MAGDVYSRGGQSAGATPSGPPGTAPNAGTASKPGSDYGPASYGSAYGSYSDYSGRSTAAYGADSTGGYSSGAPQAAGGKHFSDFKEWPASWQPIDGQGAAPPAVPGTGLAVRTVSAAVVELSHWSQTCFVLGFGQYWLVNFDVFLKSIVSIAPVILKTC